MFSIHEQLETLTVPLSVFYVDSLHTAYTRENVVIQATDRRDVLSFNVTNALVTFNGAAFPLSGSDYLTPQTGTLSITVMEPLPSGIYRYVFVTTGAEQPPAWGLVGMGLTPFGIAGRPQAVLPVTVQVQSFVFPTAYQPINPYTGKIGWNRA